MKTKRAKRAIAQRVVPLLSSISALKQSYHPQIVTFHGIRVESTFSPSQRRCYITCDEFIIWGSEIAMCSHRGKYAIYHPQKGIITPFTFDEFRPIAPNHLRVKWLPYEFTVKVCEGEISYAVANRSASDLKELLRLLIRENKD